jgi:hypothetical protein
MSDAILANIALALLGAIGLVGVAVIAARALVWFLERQRVGRGNRRESNPRPLAPSRHSNDAPPPEEW